METIEVVAKEAKVRLDKYLAEVLVDLSRTRLQQFINDGYVLVNGKAVKNSYKLELDDLIEIELPEDKESEILPEDIPLDIVYEDSDVIVVNKPSGMIVHPSVGITTGTLVNALLYHCDDLSGINGVIRPGIVHRIDKETSGLLMVAKNDNAHICLSEQLKEHTCNRRYLALVHGEMEHDHGIIDAPIGRDPKDRQKMTVTDVNSRHAVTHFTVIKRYHGFTLVECKLETGRTHQIRVHMQFIGHPVYGDPKYGIKRDDHSFGQYLHAKTLGFVHPTTKEEMLFDSELPEPFKNKLAELEAAL